MEHYLQKNLVINNRELKYIGIFEVKKLFDVINNALEEKGYTKREKKTEELVSEQGKKVFLELRPYKYRTNYLKLMIKMKIFLDKIVDHQEEVDGRQKKFQKGEITIVFDAWVITDYEQRWGMKPFVFFMKGLINKFLYQYPLEGDSGGVVAGDTAYLHSKIKNYLRSHVSKDKSHKSEEDIMKEVSKDIRSKKN